MEIWYGGILERLLGLRSIVYICKLSKMRVYKDGLREWSSYKLYAKFEFNLKQLFKYLSLT